MLSSQLLDVLHLRKSGPLVFDSRFFAVGLWRWVIFIMYGTGYYFLMSYLSRKKMEMQQAIENEKLKLDLVKSEKDFLRTQINPHLLFNTLNFVKFAAKNRPAEANEAIICLSEIMRFALEQSNTELTSIKSEVDQVKNIILLNQLRFDHTLQIDLKERIENEHLLIIPVVLLTLVENVFKHGNLVEPGYPAEINIEADQRNLIFITRNLADKGSQIQNSCTGIKNILLRLNLCYGEEHSLEYKMEGNIFITKLTIPLKTADH
ncbi:MAG: hypothetical protein EOO43_25590 [Flavobacterium sp.]|nr:MAG: hypothetical protein EOO43_25590 [Flavobacterium sp.]